MSEALSWYLALLLVGVGGLLPATALFRGMWSGGVLYARPLTLPLWGLAVWLLTAVTPVPYGQGTVLVSAAVLYLLSFVLVLRQPDLLLHLRDRWRIALAGEAIFLVFFAGLALIRAQTPGAFGNEKPMEMMLLTAIHNASSMPPEDAWFAGEPVAYYHLGYLVVDLVSRLAGLVPAEAFNLALATAGGMAAAGVFALAGDLVSLTRPSRRATVWVAASIALVSLMLVAPAQGILDLLWKQGVGEASMWAKLGVAFFPGALETQGYEPMEEWWWWHATRVIPDTITEFPAFSLLLGDLHPHVIGLPSGIVALAIAVRTTLAAEGTPGVGFWWRHRLAFVVSAALFASIYMTNPWDLLPYGTIWFLAALLAASRRLPLVRALLAATVHVALPAALALLLAAPSMVHASSPLAGVGLVYRASDPTRFALVWAPVLMPVLLAALVLRPRPSRRVALVGAGAGALAVLAWIAASIVGGHDGALGARAAGWLLLASLVLAGAWAAGAAARAHREEDGASAAWLGLLACACGVVLVTELAYLAEEYHPDTRINTVFKLWYVVWLLLSVAGGVAVARILEASRRRPRWGVLGALAIVPGVLYVGSLLYAPAVIESRADEPQEPARNALALHEVLDPELAEAMAWTRQNLGEDDLLLESVGDSHTYTNVISANTPSETLLGWLEHELIWRGRIPEIAQRWAIVHAIYLMGATEESARVARAYGITHVYLGRHEVEVYKEEVFDRFEAWPAVFEAESTRIVEVPPPPPAEPPASATRR